MLALAKCPSCGRRFSIRMLEKKLVGDERESETVTKSVLVPTARGSSRNVGTGNPIQVASVVTTERQTYESTYECRRCGHRWSERTTAVHVG